MKIIKKCPLCGAKYNKDKTCSNSTCPLSWKRPKEPISWGPWFRSVIYTTPRAALDFVLNSLFRRYDLIRTDLPRYTWSDTDIRMERAVQQLLVDFVEQERDFNNLDGLQSSTPNSNWQKADKEILDLYTLIKVDLPKLEMDKMALLHEGVLERQAGLQELDGVKVVEADVSDDAVNDSDIAWWDRFAVVEETLQKMKTDVLQRIINVRECLWT